MNEFYIARRLVSQGGRREGYRSNRTQSRESEEQGSRSDRERLVVSSVSSRSQ